MNDKEYAVSKHLHSSKVLLVLQRYNQFMEVCADAGLEPPPLGDVKLHLASQLENLVVHEEDIADKCILFFVLSGGEWWPCHAGSVNEKGPSKDWLNFRIDYSDGSSDSGVAQPLHWAYCTCDNMPNYHWFEESEAQVKSA